MQTVLPLSFQLNKRYAERVWANCFRKLFSVGFIGVGGFLGWVVFGVGFSQNLPDRGQSRKIRFSKFPGSGLKKI